jgi:hypothetical protein
VQIGAEGLLNNEPGVPHEVCRSELIGNLEERRRRSRDIEDRRRRASEGSAQAVVERALFGISPDVRQARQELA